MNVKRSTSADGVSTRVDDSPDRDHTVRYDDGDAPTQDDLDIVLPRDGVIDGRYRVVDRVGDGGMGVVLRARDQRLNREVALKLIRPALASDRGLVDQFLAEARAMAQLRHANVVEVHDFGEHDGLPYIAMRFINGPDLHSWVSGQQLPLPVDVALGILSQICEGVAAIHDAGVVHRDIKPENILLDKGFRAVVTDFGLVRRVGLELDDPASQITGGTAGYMAPELASDDETGDARLAVRADVYALGIMAYWLLVGRRPFVAKSRQQMLDLQRRARVSPPSEVRPDLARALDPIVLEALHKDPRQRTPTARQLADQLRSARRGLGRRRLRIVVVDEDAPSREWIAGALQEALPDVALEMISSSHDALDRIEADPPGLVITALENRGVSGMELAATMRGNPMTQAIPVVVLSAVGGAADWQALWRIGVQGFLLKPLVREAFVPVIRGLLPRAPPRPTSTRQMGSMSS